MPAVCIRKIYKSDEYQSVVFGFGLHAIKIKLPTSVLEPLPCRHRIRIGIFTSCQIRYLRKTQLLFQTIIATLHKGIDVGSLVAGQTRYFLMTMLE